MSKNIIDHIVANKLEGINFDFKNEYWNKMQEELDANCAQTNTCSSTAIGGFLSGTLITTFVAIISIIIFFPWEITTDSGNQKPIVCTDDIKTTELVVETEVIEESTKSISQSEVEASKEEVIIKTKKTSSTSKSINKQPKIKVATTNTKKQTAKADVTVKPEPKKNTEPTVLESDSTTVDPILIDVTNADEQVTDDSIDSAPKQEVVYESDSVYIPEGKILGNDQDKVEKDPQVNVESGLEPVKHVKTRSKPIKRVFKKRKGILYKLGIRK